MASSFKMDAISLLSTMTFAYFHISFDSYPLGHSFTLALGHTFRRNSIVVPRSNFDRPYLMDIINQWWDRVGCEQKVPKSGTFLILCINIVMTLQQFFHWMLWLIMFSTISSNFIIISSMAACSLIVKSETKYLLKK